MVASRNPNVHSYFFLADYHALGGDADALNRSTLDIAASWLAVGLDPSKVVLYRQSDIPEILELMWVRYCRQANDSAKMADVLTTASAR